MQEQTPVPSEDAAADATLIGQVYTPEEMAAIFAAEQKRLLRAKKRTLRAGYTKNKGVGLTKAARRRVKQSRRTNR